MNTLQILHIVSCSLTIVIGTVSQSAAAGPEPVQISGTGNWEADGRHGQWRGQFAVSRQTGTVSGHLDLDGLGPAGSINVIGSASDASFHVETAPQDLASNRGRAELFGDANEDRIRGSFVLPTGAIGTWLGGLSLLGRALVSEQIRAGLRAGIPQEVIIDFARDPALRRLRAAHAAGGLAPEDRRTMVELTAADSAAVRQRVLSTLPAGDVTPTVRFRICPRCSPP